MKVLGIDPGSRVTGWALVAENMGTTRLVAGGNLRLGEDELLPIRLHRLRAGLAELIAQHTPDLAAVESVFSGASAQSLIKLSHARGVVLEACAASALDVREFTPQQVKSAVVGYGRAEKSQVQRMVAILAGGGSRLPKDAADAAAVALAALAGGRLDVAIRRSVAGRER